MPLPHVSDGTLPAHVEEQRTRVSIHEDAPRMTATVEAAGAYFASGVDNSFSMERFRRDLRIEVQQLDEEEIVFDVIGIDAAIANAFRRILLSEVPAMAIDKVFILNNTSMTEDEVLAHRLGLIPIRADPRLFRERVVLFERKTIGKSAKTTSWRTKNHSTTSLGPPSSDFGPPS